MSWLSHARSNVIDRRDGKRGQCGPQERPGDIELAGAIRRFVDARPTYGYLRTAALLKRERRSDGLPPVNPKRVYRLMKKHGPLLECHTGRRPMRARRPSGDDPVDLLLVLGCAGVHLPERRGSAFRLRARLLRSRGDLAGGDARRHLRRDDPRHDGRLRRTALRLNPRTPSGAAATRQRLDLRRPSND
jgi:hypothetical protein